MGFYISLFVSLITLVFGNVCTAKANADVQGSSLLEMRRDQKLISMPLNFYTLDKLFGTKSKGVDQIYILPIIGEKGAIQSFRLGVLKYPSKKDPLVEES